jgi:hypothetical protein
MATNGSVSRADWSVDPRGGPTVGTKDYPIPLGLYMVVPFVHNQLKSFKRDHVTCELYSGSVRAEVANNVQIMAAIGL